MGDAPTVPQWTDAGSNVDDDAANPDDTDGALPSDADVVPPEPDGSGSDGDDGSVGSTRTPGTPGVHRADHTTPNLQAAVEQLRSPAHQPNDRNSLAPRPARRVTDTLAGPGRRADDPRVERTTRAELHALERLASAGPPARAGLAERAETRGDAKDA